MAKCMICGEPHKACGPSTTVTPVDSHIIQGGQTVGLKRYEVTVEGRHPHTTTLLLSDEDAKRMGVLKERPAAKARTADNKARAPRNKAAAKPAEPALTGVEEASDPGASEA